MNSTLTSIRPYLFYKVSFDNILYIFICSDFIAIIKPVLCIIKPLILSRPISMHGELYQTAVISLIKAVVMILWYQHLPNVLISSDNNISLAVGWQLSAQ